MCRLKAMRLIGFSGSGMYELRMVKAVGSSRWKWLKLQWRDVATEFLRVQLRAEPQNHSIVS